MKATIDRIEGGIAVLIPRDDENLRIQLPVSALPPDCREGDIVTITIGIDSEATREAKDRTAALIDRLNCGDAHSLPGHFLSIRPVNPVFPKVFHPFTCIRTYTCTMKEASTGPDRPPHSIDVPLKIPERTLRYPPAVLEGRAHPLYVRPDGDDGLDHERGMVFADPQFPVRDPGDPVPVFLSQERCPRRLPPLDVLSLGGRTVPLPVFG